MSLQLIEAVKGGDLARAAELIQAGEDVNQGDEQGWTPLNFASGKGDLDMVRLLVEKGADVFKAGRDQRTPYQIAVAAAHADVARYLREVEDQTPGEKPQRPQPLYCKAYPIAELRQFSGWSEASPNGKPDAAADAADEDDIVFIHQDYTVTRSMWHGEDVVFDQVTPEWQQFCTDVLEFQVPDDISLIAAYKAGSES